MKKSSIFLIISVSIFTVLVVCFATMIISFLNKTDIADAQQAYAQFLSGNVKAENKDYKITIDDIFDKSDAGGQCVLFDMNGDNIPELHLVSYGRYYILSYINDNLIIWQELTGYHKALNNGAVFYEHPGAAPSHLNYSYSVYDFYGNEQCCISFEKYDADENGIYDSNDLYFFEDAEVSKEVWDMLTNKYFELAKDIADVWKN